MHKAGRPLLGDAGKGPWHSGHAPVVVVFLIRRADESLDAAKRQACNRGGKAPAE